MGVFDIAGVECSMEHVFLTVVMQFYCTCYVFSNSASAMTLMLFFLEHVGDLCIFVLRRKREKFGADSMYGVAVNTVTGCLPRRCCRDPTEAPKSLGSSQAHCNTRLRMTAKA